MQAPSLGEGFGYCPTFQKQEKETARRRLSYSQIPAVKPPLLGFNRASLLAKVNIQGFNCARDFGGFHFLVMTPKTTSSPTAPQTSPEQARPVIFLDFDGVLILHGGEWCREAMLKLNWLCLDTAAAVVLTTSFRYSGSVRALHKRLLKNGFDPNISVLGETRDLGVYRAAERWGDLMFQVEFERWTKGHEIAAWLEQHPGATRYMVIDDQPRICAPY
jgi:hypothetical protein